MKVDVSCIFLDTYTLSAESKVQVAEEIYKDHVVIHFSFYMRPYLPVIVLEEGEKVRNKQLSV